LKKRQIAKIDTLEVDRIFDNDIGKIREEASPFKVMEVDGGIRCIVVCDHDNPEDEWVAVGMQRGKIILFKTIHLFENLAFDTFEDIHEDQVWDIKFISRYNHV